METLVEGDMQMITDGKVEEEVVPVTLEEIPLIMEEVILSDLVVAVEATVHNNQIITHL